MRYREDNSYKFARFDSCYYLVKNPDYFYSKANVYITFTQIDRGVKVYLNSGSDVRNSSKTFVFENRTVFADR